MDKFYSILKKIYIDRFHFSKKKNNNKEKIYAPLQEAMVHPLLI